MARDKLGLGRSGPLTNRAHPRTGLGLSSVPSFTDEGASALTLGWTSVLLDAIPKEPSAVADLPKHELT